MVGGRQRPLIEAALAEVFEQLLGHGNVLVIVDQAASIGALAVAIARALDIEVAYLPGLAMRRIADLHPGQGKTDARDAYIIADAARTMRLAKTLPAQILAALDAQSVTVPGISAFGPVISGVATQLREVRAERDTLAAISKPAWRPTLLPRS